MSDRTFDSYWKEANAIFSERRAIIEEEKLQEAIKLGKKETKLNIMSKEDTLIIYLITTRALTCMDCKNS